MKHLLIAMMILSLFGFVVGCAGPGEEEVTDEEATEECGKGRRDCDSIDEVRNECAGDEGECAEGEECERTDEEATEETTKVVAEEGGQ